MKKPLLCKLGFHKWGKWELLPHFHTKRLAWARHCQHCVAVRFKW